MQMAIATSVFKPLFYKTIVTFILKTNPMKNILLFLVLINASCKCSQTNSKPQATVPNQLVAVKDTVPKCIRALITKLAAEPVTNPPSAIYSYTFESKTVYYLPPVCCDNFSDLYNDSCQIIAHPDGGFTGKGDRKAPNFHDDKKDEKLIWVDKRK
jgi:hypothetical protein